ncbi:MAG TPA: hypothetical protein VMX15_03430 [Candidatus Heimdallarchaeota archaeon]|jgi:hypothetical protein|nr:hypothetical protein [Candidatus Heimdallarchaeota archaeon]
MWIAWLIIGFFCGVGAQLLYYKRVLEKNIPVLGSTEKKLREGYDLVDAIFHNIFGPVGMTPQVRIDLFNKLWRWAGREEKGFPFE